VTRPEQLADAVAALAIRLDAAELAALQAPYRPHPVVGF
jgi:1-deoxyxylulose-5-phosphate synthase